MRVLLFLMTLLSANMVDRKETTVIILHHSAAEAGNVEIFRHDHMTNPAKMWDDVGYHYVITNGNGGPDGLIQKGRNERKQGAHAKRGGRNINSLGICLVGRDNFTERQKIATVILVANLCLKYDIEPSERTIQAHGTDCPGPGLNIREIIKESKKFFDYMREIKELNKL